MILYALSCRLPGCGTVFESWLSSSSDFDRLRQAGLLSCPSCGSSDVGKGLMAPAVASPRKEGGAASRAAGDGQMAGLRRARRQVEAGSEDVGPAFASQARRMHEGSLAKRAIHGSATDDEARSLGNDGVPVLRIPWVRLDDA